MNGKRAKLLRFLAKYNMREERKGLRQYNLMKTNSIVKPDSSVLVLRAGPRALYKQWKKDYYARRMASRI